MSDGVIFKWYGIACPTDATIEIRGGPIPLACPCRYVVLFRDGADIPLVTTPHPCGHPNHFTVFIHEKAKEVACSQT